ncbi:MAG: hypothetical protein M1511_02000 [Deltaproteobacteria bacterium]|nr:hypothetical protein [Deltaproteobacteria bacterium]
MSCLKSILIVMIVLMGLTMSPMCFAGGPGGPGGAMQGPPLDYTLMGFKEQGAWYFLCTAPEYPKRIPPHYQTYGPPPPPYCGIPCAPAPMIRK